MGAGWLASGGSLNERCTTLCPCFCHFPFSFLPESPLFDSGSAILRAQYPSRSFPAAGQGGGVERLHNPLSPQLPLFPSLPFPSPPLQGGRGRWGGGRQHIVATPPEPAFSRAAPRASPLAAPLASQRAQLQPLAPLRLRQAALRASAESSPRVRPSAPPPRLLAVRSGLWVPVAGARPLAPATLPPPMSRPYSPLEPKISLSVPPLSFLPLSGSLACPFASFQTLQTTSQENPRNLCKKLTMKFKKFFDFGAIFEWIER